MAQHLDRYKEKYHKNHKIYKSKTWKIFKINNIRR